MKAHFSVWARWRERASLDGLRFPVVYALAITDEDIAGVAFAWRQDIAYFGMSNAQGGLKSRLKKFDDTIRGKRGHGGAHRFRFKHPDYTNLCARLFVSVCPFECNIASGAPDALRAMGEVAKCEYECMARYAEEFDCLPEFNDKKHSLKKARANQTVQRTGASRFALSEIRTSSAAGSRRRPLRSAPRDHL